MWFTTLVFGLIAIVVVGFLCLCIGSYIGEKKGKREL